MDSGGRAGRRAVNLDKLIQDFISWQEVPNGFFLKAVLMDAPLASCYDLHVHAHAAAIISYMQLQLFHTCSCNYFIHAAAIISYRQLQNCCRKIPSCPVSSRVPRNSVPSTSKWQRPIQRVRSVLSTFSLAVHTPRTRLADQFFRFLGSAQLRATVERLHGILSKRCDFEGMLTAHTSPRFQQPELLSHQMRMPT